MNDYILITRNHNEKPPCKIGVQKSKIVHWYYDANGKLTIVLKSSGSLDEYCHYIINDEYNSFLPQLTGLPAKDLQSDTTIQKDG